MTDRKPTPEEAFAKAAAQIEEQWKAFWTPEIAASFRRCVEGVYDPPDASWRNGEAGSDEE